MASRTLVVTGNADMSGLATSAGGAAIGGAVTLFFNDTGGTKQERAAALTRIQEKLAEEGWI